MEAAVGIAQERAGERDVEIPELLGDQLAAIGEHDLAIGEPEVALELWGALAHLRTIDVAILVAVLEERAGLALADVQIGRRLDILHHRPSLGDELGGVDLGREPTTIGIPQESLQVLLSDAAGLRLLVELFHLLERGLAHIPYSLASISTLVIHLAGLPNILKVYPTDTDWVFPSLLSTHWIPALAGMTMISQKKARNCCKRTD